jgi:hypothetical protein
VSPACAQEQSYGHGWPTERQGYTRFVFPLPPVQVPPDVLQHRRTLENATKLALGAILHIPQHHGRPPHGLTHKHLPPHRRPPASPHHATLPAEHLCTEDLTPFIKLLPFPSRAGIVALLELHRIFDADWHSLGVRVRWRSHGNVEFMLTAQAESDPVRISADRLCGEVFFVV